MYQKKRMGQGISTCISNFTKCIGNMCWKNGHEESKPAKSRQYGTIPWTQSLEHCRTSVDSEGEDPRDTNDERHHWQESNCKRHGVRPVRLHCESRHEPELESFENNKLDRVRTWLFNTTPTHRSELANGA